MEAPRRRPVAGRREEKGRGEGKGAGARADDAAFLGGGLQLSICERPVLAWRARDSQSRRRLLQRHRCIDMTYAVAGVWEDTAPGAPGQRCAGAVLDTTTCCFGRTSASASSCARTDGPPRVSAGPPSRRRCRGSVVLREQNGPEGSGRARQDARREASQVNHDPQAFRLRHLRERERCVGTEPARRGALAGCRREKRAKRPPSQLSHREHRTSLFPNAESRGGSPASAAAARAAPQASPTPRTPSSKKSSMCLTDPCGHGRTEERSNAENKAARRRPFLLPRRPRRRHGRAGPGVPHGRFPPPSPRPVGRPRAGPHPQRGARAEREQARRVAAPGLLPRPRAAPPLDDVQLELLGGSEHLEDAAGGRGLAPHARHLRGDGGMGVRGAGFWGCGGGGGGGGWGAPGRGRSRRGTRGPRRGATRGPLRSPRRG